MQKLLPLLQIRARELISEKEALIRTTIGTLETTSPAITPDQRTTRSAIETTAAELHTATHTISPEINVLALELDSEMSRYINQPFTGTIIQHYVHKQLIESLDSIKTIVQNTRESEKLLRTALAANRMGHELNEQHKIVAALSAKHACDTLIDYAKSVADVGLAAGEGVVEGSVSIFHLGQNIGDAIQFPEETAALIKSKCNNAALAVGGLFTELRKDFELAWAGDEASILEWTDRRQERGKKVDAFFDALIQKYNDTPFRDKVKAVSKFATECVLFGMLGDALFEETAAVVDMIKLEAEVASNTLKITQPHEALAAEIIELAIQTADKDASLVEGAISFIQQDTEFLTASRENIAHKTSQFIEQLEKKAIKVDTYKTNSTTIVESELPEYWVGLMKDASHNNKITIQSMEEAIVGIAAEEQGLLLGPLRRDPTPAAEFIDKFGQAWDVKAAVSRNPRGTHIFNAEVLIKKMKQEISVGENIILDLRKLENNDLLQLYTAIQNNLTNHEIQRIIVAIPNHILKGLKW